MINEALVKEILTKLGGKENIKSVQNCMTRLSNLAGSDYTWLY